MKKRLLALTLALLMLVALLTGCGTTASTDDSGDSSTATAAPADNSGTSSDTAQSGSDENESTEQVIYENVDDAIAANDYSWIPQLSDDVVTLSYWGAYSLADCLAVSDDFNDIACFKVLEDYTNVEIEWNMVADSAAEEQFNVVMASEDYCDMIGSFLSYYSPGASAALDDEIIIDLNDYAEYCPNFMALRDADEDLYLSTMTDDGRVPSFYHLIGDATLGPRQGMFIRQDWLDDLGLDTPATYDEYFEVLKAFAVEKNVKYPLAIGTSGVLALNNLASGYGIAADIADLHDSTPFYQVDGEVRFGLVQPEYKEYLQMLNEWYDAGVISSAFTEMPDFIFGNDYISCITNGEFGVWCTSNRSGDEWKEASEDPNFEATALPSVVKNEGDIVHVTGGQAMSQNDGSSIVITTQCENPEIAAQWVDIFYSDKGCEMMSWGIEGWSFIRDEDGEPRFTDLVVNNPDYTIRQMRAVCTIFIINARVDWIITAGVGVPKTELYDYVDRSIWASNNDYDYLIPTNLITMTSEESTEYNNILGDLQTYATECIPKFMNGEMDVDTQFDAFVKQLEDMGSDRLVEIMQSAYDRYLARGN